MNIPKRIIVIIIVMALILQGCAAGLGISTIGDRASTIQAPIISKNKGFMRAGRIDSDNLITSKELLDYWGKPDHIEQLVLNKEEWTYKFGCRWNGVFVILVVVPLPLLVPVGHDYITFTIEDGKVVSAYMKNDTGAFVFLCGYSIKGPTTFCGTESTLRHIDNEILDKFEEKDVLMLLR